MYIYIYIVVVVVAVVDNKGACNKGASPCERSATLSPRGLPIQGHMRHACQKLFFSRYMYVCMYACVWVCVCMP